MAHIYDYETNISVVTTPSGDKVITMNEAIFNRIVNNIYDACEQQKREGHLYTAEDTKKLWQALCYKEEN